MIHWTGRESKPRNMSINRFNPVVDFFDRSLKFFKHSDWILLNLLLNFFNEVSFASATHRYADLS